MGQLGKVILDCVFKKITTVLKNLKPSHIGKKFLTMTKFHLKFVVRNFLSR